MPCRDEGPWRNDSGPRSDPPTTKKIDMLTDHLCSMLRNIEKLAVERGAMRALNQIIPPKVVVWWQQHKIDDARRERAELENKAKERSEKLAKYNRLKKELKL